MKQFASAIALSVALIAPLAVSAESADAQQAQKSEGLTLMQQGAELFFRGLRDDLDPVVEDFEAMAEAFGPKMQALLAQMGPKLAAILDRVDDVAYYTAPEILPNGDIIIRRRADAPPYDPVDPEGDGAEVAL